MSHTILSVKLCELDDRIGSLHSRIELSETGSHEKIREQVDAMRLECQENTTALHRRMQYSKFQPVKRLDEAYQEIARAIRKAQRDIEGPMAVDWAWNLPAEELTVVAEYALDFALQAADYASLLALEAIDAQMEEEEKEEEEP